ncbi:2-phospho-L-lactate guanylyltransferase [Rhodococcus sp. Q]|uniref:2-phospho-L-lactate guanylyltransferase n=1 Tax=Rhodococcus sp. Q TaxID=2502252 RepID=UPI0010F4384F|nr:2-phospho-L-lactate guanylyltransferase [Rhodococcus sp. Q]
MSAAPAPQQAARAHVLIAVKDLRHAKSRLGPYLSADERATLTLAMVRDTVAAALSSEAVDGVTVITPDALVASAAADLGAAVFPDRGDDDLNQVLAAASRTVRSGRVVALQGDLPCLTGPELTDALAASRRMRRAVVVDHHGTGTAALIVAADDLVPLFGEDSARRHIDSGATALEGIWPGLRLDVDTPDDLAAAAALGPGPATTGVLRSMNRHGSSPCR